MSGLGEACADLAAQLAAAEALIAEPDADGATRGGRPGTRPPWNQAAAAAALDIHAGARQVAAEMHITATGRPGIRRGGSDGNTLRAIRTIADLETQVPEAAAAAAARRLARWVTAVQQLPAVDEQERWLQVRWPCPYCCRPMIRVAPRAGRVTCLAFGSCYDTDGHHPTGQMGRSELDASPCVRWEDGLVT